MPFKSDTAKIRTESVMMRRTVVHTINLSDIGGAQSMFVPFYQKCKKESGCNHQVFGLGACHAMFSEVYDYHDITASLLEKIKYGIACFGPNTVLHFQNMLGRPVLSAFLNLIPYAVTLFSEHGAIWNATDDELPLHRKNAVMSRLKICITDNRPDIEKSPFFHVLTHLN